MTDIYRYTMVSTARISAARNGEKTEHTRVHDVIPGSTIRGALAALWWRHASERGDDQLEFSQLFDHQLAVGQAVPTPDAYLVSASTWLCKYEPEAACGTYAVDAAQAWAAGHDLVDPQCDVCHGPTHTKPGWAKTPKTVRTTRTELTATGTARTNNLFSRDSIPSQVVFEGIIAVSADDHELDWINDADIRVGGKRSTMGSATITLQPVETTPADIGVRAVVRFRSPCLIVDEFGAPSLSEGDLQSELRRVAGENIDVSRSWLRSERIDGWHMQSALPKPGEWAIAAGSTVVATGLSSNGWSRLREGIGLRTLEGFGELELLPASAPATVSQEPDGAEATPDPVSPLDALVAAFIVGGHTNKLRDAQSALRPVVQARGRLWGQPPDAVVVTQLKKPWVKDLTAVARSALGDFLRSDEVDSTTLQDLDARINQLSRTRGVKG